MRIIEENQISIKEEGGGLIAVAWIHIVIRMMRNDLKK